MILLISSGTGTPIKPPRPARPRQGGRATPRRGWAPSFFSNACQQTNQRGGRYPLQTKRGGYQPHPPPLQNPRGGIQPTLPPLLQKTGPHPPPVAQTRPRFPIESRLNSMIFTHYKRGGPPHSKVREGVPYPPVQKVSGGIPTPSPKNEGGIPALPTPTPNFERGSPSPPVIGKIPRICRMNRSGGSRGVTTESASRCQVAGREDTPSPQYEWGYPPPSPKNEGGIPALPTPSPT